jgi:hypothetical protein
MGNGRLSTTREETEPVGGESRREPPDAGPVNQARSTWLRRPATPVTQSGGRVPLRPRRRALSGRDPSVGASERGDTVRFPKPVPGPDSQAIDPS